MSKGQRSAIRIYEFLILILITGKFGSLFLSFFLFFKKNNPIEKMLIFSLFEFFFFFPSAYHVLERAGEPIAELPSPFRFVVVAISLGVASGWHDNAPRSPDDSKAKAD